MDRDQLLELIPAYVLGALDEPERAAVARLLAADQEARTLLAAYQQIADALTLDAPVQSAPAHLQQDLRQRLQQRSRRNDLPSQEKIIPMVQTKPRNWVSRIAVAAVVLAAAGMMLLSVLPAPSNSREMLFQQIAAMEGAHHVAIEPVLNETIEGELVYTPIGEQAMIRVSNLPPLADDQIYELWLNSADGTVSGGTFRPAASGDTYINIPVRNKPTNAYIFFGVSLEPAGGSPYDDRPSGERIFTVDPNAGVS